MQSRAQQGERLYLVYTKVMYTLTDWNTPKNFILFCSITLPSLCLYSILCFCYKTRHHPSNPLNSHIHFSLSLCHSPYYQVYHSLCLYTHILSTRLTLSIVTLYPQSVCHETYPHPSNPSHMPLLSISLSPSSP